MYSLGGGDLSYYKHSIKHKTNMGQPHYSQRPRESKTNSLASSSFPTSSLSGPSSLPWALRKGLSLGSEECLFTPSPASRGQVLPEGGSAERNVSGVEEEGIKCALQPKALVKSGHLLSPGSME